MKHKRWQAVVMIAFAWVLWLEYGENHQGGNRERSYEPMEGFESKKECSSTRKNMGSKIMKGNDAIRTKVSHSGAIIIIYPGGSTGTLKCLPATIDPRPRSKK